MAVSSLVPSATGPTLAEITTAITTNAAPASVTNSSIATQVANNATPYGGTWTYLGFQTGNAASTVTFSGLGSYKYLKLMWVATLPVNSNIDFVVRPNNNSSSIYSWSADYTSGSGVKGGEATYNGDSFYVGAIAVAGAGYNTGSFVIENAQNSTIPKLFQFEGVWYDGGIRWKKGEGIFNSTAAVTSMSISLSSGNFNNNGNRGFYMWGAN